MLIAKQLKFKPHFECISSILFTTTSSCVEELSILCQIMKRIRFWIWETLCVSWSFPLGFPLLAISLMEIINQTCSPAAPVPTLTLRRWCTFVGSSWFSDRPRRTCSCLAVRFYCYGAPQGWELGPSRVSLYFSFCDPLPQSEPSFHFWHIYLRRQNSFAEIPRPLRCHLWILNDFVYCNTRWERT